MIQDADPIHLAYMDLKGRGFTEKKVAVYLYHIKEFLYKVDKSLDDIREEDINHYLQELLITSGLNHIIVDSLKLFFTNILNKDF